MIGINLYRRTLIDILLGRPKEDFEIPNRWPENDPDHGFRPISRQGKSVSDDTSNQSESKDSE